MCDEAEPQGWAPAPHAPIWDGSCRNVRDWIDCYENSTCVNCFCFPTPSWIYIKLGQACMILYSLFWSWSLSDLTIDCIKELCVAKHIKIYGKTKDILIEQLLVAEVPEKAGDGAYPITILFNKSIRSSTFPTCWKDSLVIPIPNHSSPNNNRLVSLLSILSKLLEKHVYGVLFHYLEETQPISNFQWGFQVGKSTATAGGYSCFKVGLKW